MFADTISSLGCEQLISWPARISPSKQSILDHIYVNNSMMSSVVSPAVITHSLPDHFPTIIHLKFKTKRKDEKGHQLGLVGNLPANPVNDQRIANAVTLKSTFCLP